MKEHFHSRRRRPSSSPIIKKLKLVCSFNGAFRRRHPTANLRYTGGETRIVSVDRNIGFLKLRSKISEIFRPTNPDFSLKYQLPASDGDTPLVLIDSDDDVRRMIEEFDKLDLCGKPSRIWVFVCNDNAGDCNDDPFVSCLDSECLNCGVGFFGKNNGLKREKVVDSVKSSNGFFCHSLRSSNKFESPKMGTHLSGVEVAGEEFKNLAKNGGNVRSASDDSLRKMMMKPESLGKEMDQVQINSNGNSGLDAQNLDHYFANFGPKQRHKHVIQCSAPESRAVMRDCEVIQKDSGLLAINMVDYDRIQYAQLSRYQNFPATLNPRDDNLFVETDHPMEYFSGHCGDENTGLPNKQDAVPVQRTSQSYLNRENFMPGTSNHHSANSLFSSGNQLVGSAHLPRSLSELANSFTPHSRLGLNNVRNQIDYSYHSGNHLPIRLDRRDWPAKCYPELGLSSSMANKGGAKWLCHPNSTKHRSGPQHYEAVEMGKLMGTVLNDQSSNGVQPKEGSAINQAGFAESGRAVPVVYPGGVVGSESPHAMTVNPMNNLLIDIDMRMGKVDCQTPSKKNDGVTMNYGPNFCGSGNEQLIHVEGVHGLLDNHHDGARPSDDGVASFIDLSLCIISLMHSSRISCPAPSHASGNISEALSMDQLKILHPMNEAYVSSNTDIGASKRIASKTFNEHAAKSGKTHAQKEEIQEETHRSLNIKRKQGMGKSHEDSKMIKGIPNDLAAFYAHLPTRELQRIKGSDLEYIKELGSGTYGTVFHGKWKGSDVAIKKIKSSCFSQDALEEERLVADFWKEAHILAELHHPNIVALYGVVTDGPTTNLAAVTEYMVNGSLKQVLRRKDRTIDRRKRLIIAMDAAFGMQYLHEKNIVHFDLKSHNFLVNIRDPQRPVCKIGDLGLSKIKQRTLVSGGVRGTIPWMAPELLQNSYVTEKVDVYSFAIVMWELLTGEEPYANLRSEDIIAGIIGGTLRPDIPRWCDPAWRSLMERCWSSDPNSRPSFSEVAAELRAMSAAMNIK